MSYFLLNTNNSAGKLDVFASFSSDAAVLKMQDFIIIRSY